MAEGGAGTASEPYYPSIMTLMSQGARVRLYSPFLNKYLAVTEIKDGRDNQVIAQRGLNDMCTFRLEQLGTSNECYIVHEVLGVCLFPGNPKSGKDHTVWAHAPNDEKRNRWVFSKFALSLYLLHNPDYNEFLFPGNVAAPGHTLKDTESPRLVYSHKAGNETRDLWEVRPIVGGSAVRYI